MRVPRQVARFVPVPIGPSRIWVEAAGPSLTLNGEADCQDDRDALRTAEEIRAALDGVRGLAALAARSLTRDASVWANSLLLPCIPVFHGDA